MKKTPGISEQDKRDSYNGAVDLERRSLIRKNGRGVERNLVPKNADNINLLKEIHGSIKDLISGTKILGIITAISFTFFMAARNVCAQLSTEGFSPFAVAAIDRAMIALCCLPYLIIQKTPLRVSTGDSLLIFLRGAISAISLSSITAAFEKLPVGDASAIQSLASIPAGIWGALFLGETFGLVDLMCAVLGAIGFSLISKPTFIFSMDLKEFGEHLEYYGLALLSALLLSFMFPIGRLLVKSKIDPVLIVFYYSLVSALLTGLYCTFLGLWPNFRCNSSLIYVIFMGGFAFFGNILCTVSLSFLETFEVAILNQNIIIFAYFLQITLLSVSSSWLSLLGATAIIFACVITALNKGMAARSNREGVI